MKHSLVRVASPARLVSLWAASLVIAHVASAADTKSTDTTPEGVARATLVEALAPLAAARGATTTIDISPTSTRQVPCARMVGFMPPGARLVGRTTVGLRCVDDGPAAPGAANATRLFIAATVKVEAPVWQAARALRAGETIDARDLVATTAPLGAAELDPGGHDLRTVDGRGAAPLGRVLVRAVAAGRPLLQADVKDAGRINPGEAVRVVYRGDGFAVSADARAVGAADPGSSLLVRLASGSVVSGILRDDRRVELPH